MKIFGYEITSQAVLASLRSVGISLDVTVGSAHLGAALASDRSPSRILTITLGLIFTGKVSLLIILWNKKNYCQRQGA